MSLNDCTTKYEQSDDSPDESGLGISKKLVTSSRIYCSMSRECPMFRSMDITNVILSKDYFHCSCFFPEVPELMDYSNAPAARLP